MDIRVIQVLLGDKKLETTIRCQLESRPIQITHPASRKSIHSVGAGVDIRRLTRGQRGDEPAGYWRAGESQLAVSEGQQYGRVTR